MTPTPKPLITDFGAPGAQGGGLARVLHAGLMRFDDYLARHAAQLPIAPLSQRRA